MMVEFAKVFVRQFIALLVALILIPPMIVDGMEIPGRFQMINNVDRNILTLFAGLCLFGLYVKYISNRFLWIDIFVVTFCFYGYFESVAKLTQLLH